MEEESKYLELSKFSRSSMKHISTLSTSAILVMAIFLNELAQNLQWRFLLVTALIAFVVSIIGALVVQVGHLMKVSYDKELPNLDRVFIAVAVLGFAVAIICLTIVAVRNLHHV